MNKGLFLKKINKKKDKDILNFSLRRLKEAKLDEQFPDEIDTPMNIPARIRFQK